jgi:hypothetical protein
LIQSLRGRVGDEYGFGSGVGALGDVNGDGVEEFSILSRQLRVEGTFRMGARVFSGRSAREVTRFHATSATGNTLPLKNAGDLDGDGRADLILGDGDADQTGLANNGEVSVVRSDDLYLSVAPPNPRLGETVTLSISAGTPGTLVAIALTGINGAPTFQFALFGVFPASEEWVVQPFITVPVSGQEFELRALSLDPSGLVVQSEDERVSFQ